MTMSVHWIITTYGQGCQPLGRLSPLDGLLGIFGYETKKKRRKREREREEDEDEDEEKGKNGLNLTPCAPKLGETPCLKLSPHQIKPCSHFLSPFASNLEETF